MSQSPFSVDLKKLNRRQSETQPESDQKVVDKVATDLGFTSREPSKPGRRPSPRTGQIHAKVLPEIAEAISEEARSRGVQQGVIIEEAWAAYLARGR